MTSSSDCLTDMIPASGAAFERLLPEWRALWSRVTAREPFAHPDWILAYLGAFEPQASMVVVTARAGDRLSAVLPLIRESAVTDHMRGRWLRAPMNPHVYRADILRDPAETRVTPRAMWEAVCACGPWDIFSVPRFARGSFIDELAASAESSGFPTLLRQDQPTLHVPLPARDVAVTESPWLATVRSGLQTHIRRSSRQGAKELGGDLRLDAHETADPALLQRFYEIEASGWKGREGTAIASAPDTLRFYNAIARVFAAEKAFTLHLLRVNDRILAGSFGVTVDGCFYPLKWGYDEAYSKYRPGRVLTAETLRDCWERGIRFFDMGLDEPHKREWTPHVREHGTLYIFNKNFYGRLLYGYRGTLGPMFLRAVKRIRGSRARAGGAGQA